MGAGRSLTASEIIKASGDKEWKNSSIHLMVNALLEKGFLEVAGFKRQQRIMRVHLSQL